MTDKAFCNQKKGGGGFCWFKLWSRLWAVVVDDGLRVLVRGSV